MEAPKGGRAGAGMCIRPRSWFKVQALLESWVKRSFEDLREDITGLNLCKTLGVKQQAGSQAGGDAEVMNKGGNLRRADAGSEPGKAVALCQVRLSWRKKAGARALGAGRGGETSK